MTVMELVSQLQILGVSPNAKIVICDDKEKEYDLIKIDTMFKGEVIFDIKDNQNTYKN